MNTETFKQTCKRKTMDTSKSYGFSRKEDIVQLEALEKRLQENPNDTDALLKKGILYYEPFLRTDESIAIFRSIIAKDPQNIDAYFWLAKCTWHYQCDFLEAERLLRIALTIDPNRADCHSLLAVILPDIIEIHFRKAIELEPTWIEPRRCFAYHLFKEGEFAKAKDEATEALKYIINTNDSPEIGDVIIYHYETFVTGRYNPKKVKAELLDFLKKIDAAIEQEKIARKQRDLAWEQKKIAQKQTENVAETAKKNK